jgi:Tol biopolymer transport system component
MTPVGSEVQQITHFDPPYEAGDTNWSSDNRKIAFEWDVGGSGQSDPDAYAEVWTMNPDGSSAVSTGIPCAGVGCAPRWQPAADEIFRSGFDQGSQQGSPRPPLNVQPTEFERKLPAH